MIFEDEDFYDVSKRENIQEAYFPQDEPHFFWRLGKGKQGGNDSEGGNPDSYLAIGLFQQVTLLTLPPPESVETWQVSFDYSAEITFSPTRIEVFGLKDGQSLPIKYSAKISGEAFRLGELTLADTTGGEWTSVELQPFQVPAGLVEIVILIKTNMNDADPSAEYPSSPRGIDNFKVIKLQ